MIIVELKGGLGNQMFQYACAKKLSIRHDTSILFDLSLLKDRTLKNTTYRDYELSVFNIYENVIPHRELNRYKLIENSNFKNKVLQRFRMKIQGTHFYNEKELFIYDPNFNNIKDNTYISGYFQSEKYFKDIESKVRELFIFRNKQYGKNIEIGNLIQSKNSISIHIRRTDFVNNIGCKVHGFCGLDYYYNAINLIKQKISDPFYFIFSDEYDWVVQNLRMPDDNYLIINNNTGKNSFEDMRLMSLCKHNIIANSSFSWWGAWLNIYHNKIVIAPKKWLNVNIQNYDISDLIPSTWIKI